MNNMFDDRQSLASGTKLNLNGNEFVIGDELGRGGSCIVYSAERITHGITQIVRLKECFPAYLGITRSTGGSLSVPAESTAGFQYYIGRFEQVFSLNQEIRNMQGATNSTIDSSELFSFNGTEYIVMRSVEGMDYSNEADDSANSVITRVLSLARVLKKYHENGFLHLDVKPENMFIIPETREHIVLFDLDSVVSLDELHSGRTFISCSEDYAAPEVRNLRYGDINACSDFYSVGALIYWKLFGRIPEAVSLHGNADISGIVFPDERYQPLFFRKLSRFFAKTLAISPAARFKRDDELISSLDELKKLSDLSGFQVISNFAYDSANFVGRVNELRKIDEAFSANHVVFLSGIGGIGKTELAKKYAYLNSDKSNRILFCHFSQSIESTINSEIQITDCEPDPGEDSREYFERKLKALRSVLTEQDMIILDNFDVSSDDDLDILLKCRCRFIITTREDYSDYNYEQIYVDSFDDIGDALNLFRSYNRNLYDEREQECIADIIELLERHTMTVELMAKYLRDSEMKPSAFLDELHTKYGVTSADDALRIKQRKDGKHRMDNVNRHLLALFDLSHFSDKEEELLGSLSLMGGIIISCDIFLGKFCAFPGNREALQRLIKSGWVRCDSTTGKIALHQVVMDLVYNNLHPDSACCPEITRGMAAYCVEEIENIIDSNMRNHIVNEFVDRTSGGDNSYAALLLNYGKNLSDEQLADDDIVEELLDEAEKCCDNTIEGMKIRKNIHFFRIHIIGLDDAVMDFMNDTDSCEPLRKILYSCRIIAELAEKADDPLTYANDLVDVAWLIHDKVSDSIVFDDDDSISGALEYGSSLLQKAADLIAGDGTIAINDKISLLRQIRNFYSEKTRSGEDDLFISQEKNMCDMELSEKYLGLITEYKKQSAETDDSDEDEPFVSDGGEWVRGYEMLSFGEYESAVSAYDSDISRNGITFNNTAGIINALLLHSEPETALNYAGKLFAADDRPESRLLLAYSLYRCGFTDDIPELCSEMINPESGDTVSFQQETGAYYLLYLCENDTVRKNEYWNMCESLYEENSAEYVYPELDPVYSSFVVEYSDKSMGPAEAIPFLYEYIVFNKLSFGAIFDYLTDNSEKYGLVGYKALAYLFRAECALTHEDICEKNGRIAKAIVDGAAPGTIEPVLLNKVYYKLSRYLLSYEAREEYKQKCDIFCLADSESENMTPEDAADLWGKACKYSEDSDVKIRCLRRYFSIVKENVILPYEYAGKICDCAELYMDKGDKQAAIEIMSDGMRVIAEYYLGGKYDSESMYPKDEYHGTMREKCDLIADNFNSIFSYYSPYCKTDEYCRYYISSKLIVCFIQLAESYSDDLVRLFVRSDRESMDKLSELFGKAVSSPDAPVYINDIVDIYEDMPPQFTSEKEFTGIDGLFQQYFHDNCSDDISFKE